MICFGSEDLVCVPWQVGTIQDPTDDAMDAVATIEPAVSVTLVMSAGLILPPDLAWVSTHKALSVCMYDIVAFQTHRVLKTKNRNVIVNYYTPSY